METQTTEHLKIGTKLWKMSWHRKSNRYKPCQYVINSIEIEGSKNTIIYLMSGLETDDWAPSRYSEKTLKEVFRNTIQEVIIEEIKYLSNLLQ